MPPPSQLAISAADELAEARRLAIGAAAILAIVAGHPSAGRHDRALVGARGDRRRGHRHGGRGVGLDRRHVAWRCRTSCSSLALSAVTGGSLAALVLSHWYLVTPRISERPLLLATRVLIATLVVQLLLFATWQVVALDGGDPFAALTGPNALLVWLRLIVGLLFPLVLDGHGVSDGADALDGIGDRPALHRVRGRARVDDRRRGPDARRGPARMRMCER